MGGQCIIISGKWVTLGTRTSPAGRQTLPRVMYPNSIHACNKQFTTLFTLVSVVVFACCGVCLYLDSKSLSSLWLLPGTITSHEFLDKKPMQCHGKVQDTVYLDKMDVSNGRSFNFALFE